MLRIADNGIITLTRGDTAKIPLFINQGSKLYPIRYSLLFNPSSEIYLGIMEPGQEFENSLVRKKFTKNSPHTSQNDLEVEFNYNDTINLRLGRYYMEIKLLYKRQGVETIYTVVPKRLFILE